MHVFVYEENGSVLLTEGEAVPECGEDFCDRCGDCLACYGVDPCYDGGVERRDHFWVVYGLEEAARLGLSGASTPGI